MVRQFADSEVFDNLRPLSPFAVTSHWVDKDDSVFEAILRQGERLYLPAEMLCLRSGVLIIDARW